MFLFFSFIHIHLFAPLRYRLCVRACINRLYYNVNGLGFKKGLIGDTNANTFIIRVRWLIATYVLDWGRWQRFAITICDFSDFIGLSRKSLC